MAAASGSGTGAAAGGGDAEPTTEIDKLSEAERVKDISKSPAFAFLDDCVKKQILTPGQVSMYKRQYERVHEAVLTNYANETKCLAQSKQLKAVLDAERTKLEKRNVSAQEVQAENELLSKEEKESDTAVKFMDDEKDMLTRDADDLTKQKDESRRRVEEKHRKGLEELIPTIDNLKKSIDDLRKDIASKSEAIRTEIKESQKKTADIEYCQQQIAKNTSLIEKKKHELSQAVGEPDRLKATIESLRIQAIDLERGNEAKTADIAKLDEREEQEQGAIQAARDAWTALELDSDRFKEQIKIEHDRVREVQHELDFSRAQFEEDCLELQKIEETIADLKLEEKHQSERLKDRQKEHRDVKKDYESAARIILTYQSQIPSLQREVESKTRDLEEKRAQLRLQKAMADEIHQDIELFYSQCLAQEKIDEDTKRQLDGVMADKKELEKKIHAQLAEEKQLHASIAHLRGLRDNAAREASRAYNEKREMEENLKIKNILLLDLKKQFLESQTRLQKCEHDYEYIKNLANRTINLTQSRSLALAELKERIKIKQNEEEILKNEGRARQRALQDQARQIKIAQNFLAAYKLEQNKYKTDLKQKKDMEDQHNMEINKLLSIVELAEKEMVRLREAYARSVDRRNFTGIQLIDRNDELYVLYEKHDIQEQQLKTGDAQTKNREAEIGEIRRQMAELQRRMETVKKRVPAPSVFTATTVTLKQLEEQLKKAREETKVLCEQLENPSGVKISVEDGRSEEEKLLDPTGTSLSAGTGAATAASQSATAAAAATAMATATVASAVGSPVSKKLTREVPNRCRVLKGVDPEPEQLAAKIEVLEERLNDKKEQLLEKELVLDEVTSLSDKLRLQASEQRELTLELAKKVNEYQARIRATNHKMMAAVSELSMYQAQAMKLEQTKAQRSADLKTARDKLAAGQPPTDESEQEWYRKERDRIIAKEAIFNRARYQRMVAGGGVDAAPGSVGGGGTAAGGSGPMARPRNTRADDRPNAYIPEDLGLPKPYFGSLAPFKPSLTGTNMRHVRKPVVKEVVL